MPVTKEEILKKHTASKILPYADWLHSAMDKWAAIQTAERDARIKAMQSLLEKYEEWEAMLIEDNAMWWPNVDKDKISGKTYEMMMELQSKRNELLGR